MTDLGVKLAASLVLARAQAAQEIAEATGMSVDIAYREIKEQEAAQQVAAQATQAEDIHVGDTPPAAPKPKKKRLPMPPKPGSAGFVIDDELIERAGIVYNAGKPICPGCGHPMWDNRGDKKNPKGPDFRCQNKQHTDDTNPKFGFGIWLKNYVYDGETRTLPGMQDLDLAPADVVNELPWE